VMTWLVGLFQGGPLALRYRRFLGTAINCRGAGYESSCATTMRPVWPEGLVVDGEIVDADLFGRELKTFVTRTVCVAVPPRWA